MDTLKAEKRSMDVKAKRLRREGYVTGNVIGHHIEQSIPVKMDRFETERFLKEHGKGSQGILDVEGTAYPVLVKDISYNPMKRMIEEVDFQALVANEKIHSVAEIVLLNHEKVVNGVLEQNLEEIEYRAYPSAIVDKIEIDVGSMKTGDVIHVKDLDIVNNKDVEIHTDLDSVVVSVFESRNRGEISEEESEVTAEA